MSESLRHFRELRVYQAAMDAALRIFELTRSFPADERFSLTDQIRRSSRSVCANLAEAWRKRRYEAAFVAKLNDAEAEAAETQVWLEIASRNGYLKQDAFTDLDAACESIQSMLVKMISEPSKWTIRK
ncbi:MAG: four helix bundle protein [Terrimicrobiaceae bacterium]|nr:four helix bundle protein [Terrimicrobiaceae bacterium]